MPRKLVPIIPNFPYHINARSVNGEWFDLPMKTVWSIMSDYLFLMANGFNIQIHAFVLMSNHFHLLVTPNGENLSSAILYFMRETSKEITRLSGRINQTYGNRNHKTLIGCHHYFMNTYKYIYRNPIRADLSQRVEDYPFSTLHGLLGRSRLDIPLISDEVLFSNVEESLQWLNKGTELDADENMRLALRRTVFKYRLDVKTEKSSRWETELI